MKGIHVKWCLNDDCSLFGHECYESQCTRCGTKATQLTWTLIICKTRGIYMGLVEWQRKWRTEGLPAALTAYCVRNCIQYVGGGVDALATKGPSDQCRISGMCEEKLLGEPYQLTAISGEALSAWEDEPWRKA